MKSDDVIFLSTVATALIVSLQWVIRGLIRHKKEERDG